MQKNRIWRSNSTYKKKMNASHFSKERLESPYFAYQEFVHSLIHPLLQNQPSPHTQTLHVQMVFNFFIRVAQFFLLHHNLRMRPVTYIIM